MQFELIFFLFVKMLSVSLFENYTKNDLNIPSNPKPIVVIFQRHEKINEIYTIDNGISFKISDPEVSYFINSKKEECFIHKDQNADTIIIYPIKEYCILRHRVDAIRSEDFLFKQGDTILFTYENNRPFASALNRKTLPYDLNYEVFLRNKFSKNLISPDVKYFKSDFFLDYNKPVIEIEKQEKIFRQKTYLEAKEKYLFEDEFLDSIKNGCLISPDVYVFYKSRVRNISLLLDLAEEKLSIDKAMSIVNKDSTVVNKFPDIYYYSFLEGVADKLFTEKARTINLKDGVNKDYREIYSEISKSGLFSTESKNYLLTREISRIIKTFSINDIRAFFKKYKEDVTDTLLISQIENQFFIELNQENIKTDLLRVININNQKTTFDEIKRKNIGNMFYVDFWASWCVPCRKKIPATQQLMEKYRTKKILFIFLSIDRNFGNWEKAAIEENLNSYENSFLITNANNSGYLKKLGIETIPRYILFDKKGNLVHLNAPDPENNQLYKELDKLLK